MGNGGRVWWLDEDTGITFNEDSLLYAWNIVCIGTTYLNADLDGDIHGKLAN